MAKAGKGVRTRQFNPRQSRRNYFEERIAAGSRVAVISANESTGPFSTRVYVDQGRVATLTVKKAKTIEGARKQARLMLAAYSQNPGAGGGRKRGNPRPDPATGLHVEYSPVNQAYFVMWHNSLLNIVNSKAEAREIVKDLTRKNPGATNLAQYVMAAVEHTRGAHDAGGKILHETPKAKRREFAKEIAWRKGYRNPNIVDAIRPGDRVTILTPHGSQLTGRAVMRSSSGGWVLNLGGRHGTPGLADNENIVKVKPVKRGNPVKLSGMGGGEWASIPAEDVRVGMKVLFNFGYRYDVVKVENSGANVIITMRKDGKDYSHRYKKTTQLAAYWPGRNPDPADALYKTFHGRGPDKTRVMSVELTDPYQKHPALAQLGKLKSLTVGEFVKGFKGRDGDQPIPENADAWAVQIDFDEGSAPDVAAEPGGRQVFIVGGNQNVEGQLPALRVDPDKDPADAGFVYRIEYTTKKDFDGFRTVNYWHHFGEETGVQPRLIIDRANRRLQLAGGEYIVKREGIVN